MLALEFDGLPPSTTYPICNFQGQHLLGSRHEGHTQVGLDPSHKQLEVFFSLGKNTGISEVRSPIKVRGKQ